MYTLQGLLYALLLLTGNPPSRPFPQHVSYQAGTILPNHVSREEMDDSVRSFYNGWKKKYVRKGCASGEYYVWFGEPGNKQCVSEGQGYGMMILALMAGYEDSAQSIYDGLFRYYRAHPARTNPYLMAWAQKKGCQDVDRTTATDGDLDIAYSLLLAHTQWGDQGAINYLEEGRKMIRAILQQEINPRLFTTLLSDAIEPDSKDYSDMRSSDFIPAHFRAFRAATGDTAWSSAIGHVYGVFDYMVKTYSPETGLVPDFIVHIREKASTPGASAVAGAQPAPPNYLESRYDGRYNYNACRVPWRLAEDYLIYGSPESAAILQKINHWIRTTTRGNPDNISAGYSLAGEDLPHRYFEALSFITPFAVAAMADRTNQQWLNSLWDYIIHFRLKDFDYYDNSIKMIGLIMLSGNEWTPQQ